MVAGRCRSAGNRSAEFPATDNLPAGKSAPDTMNSLISKLRLVLLAAWLGVAMFFGVWVAPTLFGVLRGAGLENANTLAGTMVNRLLGIINKGGFEIALFGLVTAFFINREQNRI